MLDAAPSVKKKSHLWVRDALDWYQEPSSATAALLQRESFEGRVWDPACGGGNIVKTMRARGISAFGSDKIHRGLSLDDGWLGEMDFLADVPPIASYENLVFNPPFFRAVGAEAFIRRALAIATRKVAAFVDIRFIAGSKRANGIFAEVPPCRVYIITPRPSCPPGSFLAAGGVAGNGSSDWCWLVWCRDAPARATQLDWLRGSGEALAA